MKKFTSIFIALVMSITLAFTLALSGCDLTGGDNSSSSTGGGNSSATEPAEPQKIDRSEYTLEAVQTAV